jgi:hypothetical protein
MKNSTIRKWAGLLAGVALLGVALQAGAWGQSYQSLSVYCGKQVCACIYDDQGNCLGGTCTITPGSQIICWAAQSGSCTGTACAYGAPYTVSCCSN